MVVPHLLYPEVQLFSPRIRIYLYKEGKPTKIFGADALNIQDLAVGILLCACADAGVSCCDRAALRRYSARVEVRELPVDALLFHYDEQTMEFKT